MQPDLEDCCGCGAAPDTAHDRDCDWAACPECGEQLLLHACGLPDSGRPPLWHGIDQRCEVARAMNWWATAVGVDHLMEDYTRVTIAIALRQVAWDQRTQKYVIGSIDEAELDRVLGQQP
jgi:hypothetical protein